MVDLRPTLAEKRRILQLETLYDLALALQIHRPEEELVEELLQRACAVLDPQAAVVATRNPDGSLRAMVRVGWPEGESDVQDIASSALWPDIEVREGPVGRRDGELAGREYRELLATGVRYRGKLLGLLAVVDKESRRDEDPSFTDEDARFLESVAALAGVALDSARQVEELERQRETLVEENRALKEQISAEVDGRRIVAYAPAMRAALERTRRVAPRGVSVLVRGESGTGKELISRLLHVESGREGPLIALNCAALPESLLESELFGIEGGVATGVKARRGKFELAEGGTLFLDEIGDMALSLQVKLLRTLQEREVVRVGGQQSISVDVRVVAATHRQVEEMVRDGSFREDLYYRLRGVEIDLPPLRERREDIAHLVRYFASDFCRRESIPEPHFSRAALTVLLAHDYPGNVRELQNLVEGSISLAEGEVDDELIYSLLDAEDSGESASALDLASVEARHITRMLRLAGGNKTAAARILGVTRRTLLRKGY